ncbi:hypothetical protein ACFC1T_08405 [Kitasatospora sp. NPDC056076]|uniref:hypothetical protein n=1 Tax=Kitasatospora sp. NPDC056076 TaxID=3345703 RepID=UPI0035E37293
MTTCGYTIDREIVDVLLNAEPTITAEAIREAGGGLVAVVLTVQDRRRLRLRRLAQDLLRLGNSFQVAAISIGGKDGERDWAVVPLTYLQGLARDLTDLQQQLRLEAVLRRRG